MQPTGAPEAATSIPPSDVSRFLHQDNRSHDGFRTPEFAAYFALTVREAQGVLNNYAVDGLLTFSGLTDGVESWEPSRDGLSVFGLTARAKRLTKKVLAAVAVALEQVAEVVCGKEVAELSIGGRPTFGKLNGKVVIGIRLAHEPYTHPEDEQVLYRVVSALCDAGAEGCFSIVLFEGSVPERLHHRIVVAGPQAGRLIKTPASALDLNEVKHLEGLERFLLSKGIQNSQSVQEYAFTRFDPSPKFPYSVLHFLRVERQEAAASVACQVSPVQFTVDVDDYLKSADSGVESAAKRMRGRPDWSWGRDAPTVILAEVDYAISTGRFKAYCETFNPDELWRFRPYPNVRGEFPCTLLALLLVHRERIGQARIAKAERKTQKKPAIIRHYAIFDCLNFPRPHLVAFIRQPASAQTSVQFIHDWWSEILRSVPDMPAAALGKAGFNAAYLSLAHRPATPEETEAYTALSHKAGRTLKCVIAVDEKCMVAAVKGSRGLEDFGIMPAILAKARLEHPALPKLLRGTAWYSGREGVYLFDKIEQLSPNLKAVLCTHLINTETVLMSDFAEKASALQCDDRVVLASGLREHWVFASRNRDWRATISDSSWKVALSSENDVLSIELESHDDEYILQLSPYERQPDLRPYGGFLSSLLPFMQQLQALKEFGLDARWAYALANEGEGRSPRGRGEWFATLISEMMHGINGPTHLLRVMNCGLDWDLEQWDGTSWPCFEFDERDVAI